MLSITVFLLIMITPDLNQIVFSFLPMTPATPQTPSRRACLPEETTENLPRFEADEELSIVIGELYAHALQLDPKKY